jgi:hypothetical protein
MRILLWSILGLLWSACLVSAAPVTLQWKAPVPATGLTGYQVQRCAIPSGQTTCAPTADLPQASVAREVMTFTDPAPPSGLACYSVVALYGDTRSAATDDVCTTTVALTHPTPSHTTVQPVGNTMVVTWTLPVFNASTLPANTFKEQHIWRGPQSWFTDSTGWALITRPSVTTTTWTDPSPLAGTNYYQVGAIYEDLTQVWDGEVGATTQPVSTLGPATNLRIVLP